MDGLLKCGGQISKADYAHKYFEWHMLTDLLAIHKLPLFELRDNPKKEGLFWYQYYTWSAKDEEMFVDKFVDLGQLYLPFYVKKYIRNKVNFFILGYGYRTDK